MSLNKENIEKRAIIIVGAEYVEAGDRILVTGNVIQIYKITKVEKSGDDKVLFHFGDNKFHRVETTMLYKYDSEIDCFRALSMENAGMVMDYMMKHLGGQVTG